MTALDPVSQLSQGALKICEQERGTGRGAGRQLLWTKEAYLSLTLTPCLVPLSCYPQSQCCPRPVIPGLSALASVCGPATPQVFRE